MSKDKIKAVFLDRDGVLNKEIGYLYKIDDFEYTKNCADALKIFRTLGYEIIIITNQSGIARGYYAEEDYQKLTKWYLDDLKNKGVEILDVFHCPHHPEGSVNSLTFHCRCRKPSPGMFSKAVSKHHVDIKSSFLVGDKLSDIEAGRKIGIENLFLVETGHSIPKESRSIPVYESLYSLAEELFASIENRQKKCLTNKKFTN